MTGTGATYRTIEEPRRPSSAGMPAGAPMLCYAPPLHLRYSPETARAHALPPPLTTRRPSATTRQDRVLHRLRRDTGGFRAAAFADFVPSLPALRLPFAPYLHTGRRHPRTKFNRSIAAQACPARSRCIVRALAVSEAHPEGSPSVTPAPAGGPRAALSARLRLKVLLAALRSTLCGRGFTSASLRGGRFSVRLRWGPRSAARCTPRPRWGAYLATMAPPSALSATRDQPKKPRIPKR